MDAILFDDSGDGHDFMRAGRDRETRAHLPEGTLAAITGGKEPRIQERAAAAGLDECPQRSRRPGRHRNPPGHPRCPLGGAELQAVADFEKD